MTDIIEQLEKATGPAFVLDREIMYAVFDVAPERRSPGDMPKPYTASLDAALTLVPPGAEYEISTLYGIAHVAMPLNAYDCQAVRREDGNVPLAICIAALKARQSLSVLGRE